MQQNIRFQIAQILKVVAAPLFGFQVQVATEFHSLPLVVPALVVVTVDKQNSTLVGRPEVVTRGFVSPTDEKLIAGSADRIATALEKPGEHFADTGLLKAQVKDNLSAYLYEQTRRRPLVFPVIVEV